MLNQTFFIIASQVLSTGTPQTKTYYENGKPYMSETFHKASCEMVEFDKKGNVDRKWSYDFVINDKSYKEFKDQISWLDSDLEATERGSAEFITVTRLLNSVCEVYSADGDYGPSILTVIRD